MIWRPDTCGCAFEYDGPNDAAHLTRIVTLCPVHTNHDDARNDNLLKNRAVNTVAQAHGLEDASVVAWRFDTGRNVIVSHPSGALSGLQRAELRAALALIHPTRIVVEG